jgi:hypothetical protein
MHFCGRLYRADVAAASVRFVMFRFVSDIAIGLMGALDWRHDYR